MSRRDQLFQAVNSVQGQVYDFIDTHAGPSPHTPAPSTSARRAGRRRRRHQHSNGPADETATSLPLYSQSPGHDSEAVPSAVLHAPPGQAQLAADRMPRSRLARGTGRDARQAAAALREEQLRTGELKTKHTFVSSGARVLLDLDTIPQKTLTYMGGTQERGRGAIKGKVTIHAQANERVSAIRLKIKAVVRVLVPRAGTPQQPFVLDRSHPSIEPSTEKETLLLQLESQLYESPSSSADGSDPSLLRTGPHEYPFSIDLPSRTSKGVDLPPSFVLAPLNKPEQVQRPQPKSKWEAITASIPVPTMSNDWASVKWYMKLTVERPGLFRANERIFAPFVYLPPPPAGLPGIQDLLGSRLRLAAEVDSLLQRFQAVQGSRPIDLQRLCEPLAQWETIRLAYGQNKNRKGKNAQPVANAKGGKPGFFSKMLFGAQVEQDQPAESLREAFALHIPKKPFVFALRSGVPYILSRSVEWSGRGTIRPESLSKIPTVGLFQRANVYARGKGPIAGTTSRFVAPGRQPPDPQPVFVKDDRSGVAQGKSQSNRRAEYWMGMIDLPPTCAPCFETPNLTLEYYLGVRSPYAPDLLYTEPIVLVCPPSKPVRVPLAVQPPSRTGTPSNDPRRRQGSSDAGAALPSVPHRTPNRPDVQQGSSAAGKASAVPDVKRPVNGLTGNGRPTPPVSAPDHSRRPSAPGPAAGPSQATTSSNHAAHGISPSSASANEKRGMQVQNEEQMRIQAQTAPSSHPGPSHASSSAASQTTSAPPPPPPRPQTAAPSSVSALPGAISAGAADQPTPLRMDDPEVSADESEQWLFQDDELTDLPPSYFEATGVRDED